MSRGIFLLRQGVAPWWLYLMCRPAKILPGCRRTPALQCSRCRLQQRRMKGPVCRQAVFYVIIQLRQAIGLTLSCSQQPCVWGDTASPQWQQLLPAGLMQASAGPAHRLRQLVIDLEAPKPGSTAPAAAAAAASTTGAADGAAAGSAGRGSGTAAGTGAIRSSAGVARPQQPALGACDGRLVAVRDGTCLPDLQQLNEDQRAAVMQ